MATLVTGGSGVIGAEVIRLLLERGRTGPGSSISTRRPAGSAIWRSG
jgi:uncharacterized protein YbjT (DUF2867 family)